MTSARRVAKALAPRDASPTMLVQAVVASVAADASSAVVDAADGTSYAVYPAHGVLPAQGQTVFLARNGDGDVVVMGGGLLVDGSFATFGHSDDPNAVGWGLYSDGTLIINRGVVRADLAANLFTTSEDDTAPRVVIDSPADARRIQMFTGDIDELAPGYVRSQDDAVQATVEIGSPEFTTGGAGKHALLRTGIDRTNGSTFVDAVADNIRSNGVSITSPPMSEKGRSTPLGPIGSSATTAQAILWDTDIEVAPDALISYVAGSGTWLVKRGGRYRVETEWAWIDNALGLGDGTRRIRVEENGTQRTIGTLVGVGNGTNTLHNCGTNVYVPSTASETNPYTVRLFAGQVNGFGLGLTGTGRGSIERRSN